MPRRLDVSRQRTRRLWRPALLILLALASTACGSSLGNRVRTLRSPVHVALMADAHDSRIRTATAGVAANEEAVGLVSLDLTVQPAEGNGLGFAARAIGGGESAPNLTELGVLVGSRRLAVDVGIGTRSAFDPDDPDDPYEVPYPIARLGIRSRMDLGQSPFSVHFRAARHIGIGGEADDDLGSPRAGGWNAETALSYTARRFPVTGNLGYRIERFEVFNRDQEVTSLYVGVGVLFGRR